MQGDPVDVTARISNGSGDPDSPDHAPDVRGLAVTCHLPDRSRTDILAQTAPRFPVRTPEAFIELVCANQPGFVGRLKVLGFLARHPDAIGALRVNVPLLKPPPSYATCRFYATHAFKWIDADEGERWVRYTWLPEAVEADISAKEARDRGPDYLQHEIAERLERGPVRFLLQLQLAADGDPTDDPMAVWPADREKVTAGTLELTDVDSDAGDSIIFDPTRLTDGIEPSEDPILLYRAPAYSVSFTRRTAA